jgi:hypothetical protein
MRLALLFQVIALLCLTPAWAAKRTVNFAGIAVSHFAPDTNFGTGFMHLYCDIVIVNVGNVTQSVESVSVTFLNAAPLGGNLAQGAGLPTAGTAAAAFYTAGSGNYGAAALPFPLATRAAGPQNAIRVRAYNTFSYKAANVNFRLLCAGTITVKDPGNTPGSVIASGSLEYLANHDGDIQRMYGQACPTSNDITPSLPNMSLNMGQLGSPQYTLDATSPYDEPGFGCVQCDFTMPIGPPPPISFGCPCGSCTLYDPAGSNPPGPRSTDPTPSPYGGLAGGGHPWDYWLPANQASDTSNPAGTPTSHCYTSQQGPVYGTDPNFYDPPAVYDNNPMNITSFPQSIGSQPIMINGGKPF